MPSGPLLMGFIVAALVVLLTPGPGVLYVMARSAAQGYRAGFVSALGLSAGALVHVAAAAVGLSAILLTSATAFNVVKVLGAGYLIYLGIRTIWFNKTGLAANDTLTPVPMQRLFTDGVIISILNPKIAIFFMAFLPQFVDPERGSGVGQIALLGMVYAALALCTDSAYAVLANRLRQWMSPRATKRPWPRYLSGWLYIGLGINAALVGNRN